MKKVLITGKGSYIGGKVEEWLKKYPDQFEVDVLDMIGESWKKYDFHGYDSIYHVAGIAHRKDVPDELYESVNHILAVEVARKAEEAGVKQFIFMSSGAVYTQNDKKHKSVIVGMDSKLEPSTSYGKSKLKAEKDLLDLNTKMKIVIIRPPMVYGPGAKGNYNTLSKFARITPIVPRINNHRSMIYIDNLAEFVKLLILNESEGIFIPQNREYINTCDLIDRIACVHDRKILFIDGFGWFVNLLGVLNDGVNKASGSYIYMHPEIEYFNGEYQIIDFEESVYRTETWNKH